MKDCAKEVCDVTYYRHQNEKLIDLLLKPFPAFYGITKKKLEQLRLRNWKGVLCNFLMCYVMECSLVCMLHGKGKGFLL